MPNDAIIYSMDDASAWFDDPDTARAKLEAAWGISLDRLWVHGRVREFGRAKVGGTPLWKLADVIDGSGRALAYPIADLGPPGRMDRTGVFIGSALPLKGFEQDCLLRCQLELAAADERRRRENPLMLRVARGSAAVELNIPTHLWAMAPEGLRVDRQIVRWLESRFQEKIEAGLEAERELLQRTTEQVRSLTAKRADLEATLVELADARQALEREHVERSRALEMERTSHRIEVETERARLDSEKESLMAAQERLLAFVRSRAKWLHQVGWLTDELRAQITDEVPVDRSTRPQDRFEVELGGDWSALPDRVQRFLRQEGLYYPRALLANFLALLRTYDFVILTGLSGSGKTGLIRSVARAIGAEARIVPVKPNWASAEDLLGYYNPLDRSFMATPFLDIFTEARAFPDTLFLVCLDEMNLARVEYYLADFLSAMEDRDAAPCIRLFSDTEQERLLHELQTLTALFDDARARNPDASVESLADYLRTPEVDSRLRELWGCGHRDGWDAGAFLDRHTRIGRTLSTALSVRPTLEVPDNVRLIGAINVDETTCDLSAKVLDRAHVVEFASPLTWVEVVESETAGNDRADPVWVRPSDFGARGRYPRLEDAPELVARLKRWNIDYLEPLDAPMGFRTIQQSILYRRLGLDLGMSELHALNYITLQKILPRLAFDMRLPCRGAANETREARTRAFASALGEDFKGAGIGSNAARNGVPYAAQRLLEMIDRAKASDGILNFF